MFATATDLQAVAAAVAELAALGDHGSTEDYLRLLAEDAVWTIATSDVVKVQDRVEFEASLRSRRAAGTGGPGSGLNHVVTTVEVAAVGESSASAVSFYVLLRGDGVDARLMSCGRYDDLWRHSAGGWRIARRTVSTGWD